MILGAVFVRGVVSWLVGSKSDDARRWCWLPLTAVCALSACTLTESAFEPSSVSRVDNELTPDESGSHPDGAGPEHDDNTATAPDEPSSEGHGLDGVPLDPAGPNPPGSGSDDESSAASGAPGADTDGSNTDGSDTNGVDAGADPAGDGTGTETDGSPTDTGLPPSESESCPGQVFGASCYELFAGAAAWAVADQRCVAWGGHLASVESFAENDFLGDWPALLGVPVGDGSGIWIGGTDAALDGDFRWWDGSALLIESWAPNQPDNGAGLDCIEKRNDGTGLWYDRRCTDAQRFVCERPL